MGQVLAPGSELAILGSGSSLNSRPAWLALDDVIMGGRSGSTAAYEADGVLVFQGGQ
jgi:hypothetical protein